MKRVLHQEWLEKWLAGEDVELQYSCFDKFVEYNLEEHSLCVFNIETVKFRTPPKLLTIDVDEMLQFLNDNTWAGDVQTNKVSKYIKDLLAKQESVD